MSQSVKLDALINALSATEFLWRPKPFCEIRPAWFERYPDLGQALLTLPESQVAALHADWRSCWQWMTGFLPSLPVIDALADFPVLSAQPVQVAAKRWARHIPGRKQAQIEHFAACMQPVNFPVLDWCGGKGHLGRLIGLAWERPVTTLELNPALCAAGAELAQALSLAHRFQCSDALQSRAVLSASQHVVALHACGHLHRSLLGFAVEAGARQLDVVPCCYHIGVKQHYVGLSGRLPSLALDADAVRLALTETVTAPVRLHQQRDKEMAWKLAFDLWRRELGYTTYQSFKPVPAPWYRLGFSGFMQAMCQRSGLTAPIETDCTWLEQAGYQRQDEVMRLSLLRSAFRRALEACLLLDMVVYLEAAGYAASVGQFCPAELTPRNLLLSAVRQ